METIYRWPKSQICLDCKHKTEDILENSGAICSIGEKKNNGCECPSFAAEESHEEAVKRYINSGGTICPFCGSTELIACEITAHQGVAYQDCSCSSCHKSWTDEYTLYDFLTEEN
jgi:hypothetical protein